MENILALIDRPFLVKCLAGTPLEVETFTDGQLRKASVIMSHCVLNGPVGVNKVTTFPMDLQGSIKSILEVDGLTNGRWTATCEKFARALKLRFSEICSSCQQSQMYGDIWPLHGKSGRANL